MTDDKIAEIRARHARHELVGSSGSVIDTNGFSWTIPGLVAHADRATLLAEVDRLRADLALEKSRIVLQRGEIEKLRADNERLRTEIDGLEAELALMKSGFEIAYRAMGDKP